MKYRLLLIALSLLLSVQAYSQCSLSVKINQSAASICSGYTVTLTAVASGGTAPFTYAWSTGDATPTTVVDKAGTYTVTVSDKTPGCQPVKQSITIGVTTTPNAPTAANMVVCLNSSATLTATAPGGTYQWYDAPTKGTFLASGATYTTPPITAITTFYVETTLGGCTSSRTPVTVTLTSKPTAPDVTICSGNTATLTASGGTSFTWYSAPNGGVLLSSSNTYTTPVLSTTTIYYVSSVTNGCSSPRTAATVTVTPTPQMPAASNVSVCSGTPANLHASGNAMIFNWYSVPAGGVALISSPDYTTPPLMVNTTYYVSASNNGCESPRTPVNVTVITAPSPPGMQSHTVCYQSSITLTASGAPSGTYQWYDAAGSLLATGNTFTTPMLTSSITYFVENSNGMCSSARSAVNISVQPQLPSPSVSGVIVCSGSAATLTASSSGGFYQWYNAANGGTLLATGSSYTTPPLAATTTYYVQNIQAGCVSPRAAATVSVQAALAAPTAANTSVCSGNPATLSATGSAGGYAWYDKAAGGTLLATTQVFVTPVLTVSITYYVESNANGCTSQRTAVTVTVNPTPTAPIANGVTICANTSASLTATASAGTIKWYDAATGGTLLATGSPFNTPILVANTTYYAEAAAGLCQSPRTAVTVTVNPIYDPQFQYPSGTFCFKSGNVTPVINNPNGGTFSAAPAGLVFINNKTGAINLTLSATGVYIVSFTSNAPCPNTSSQKIVISSNASTGFTYSGPYCQGGSNPFPTYIAGGTAGTFTSAPAGLLFVNTSTGEINLTKSKPGTYTITNTFAAGGTCAGSVSTASVTIDLEVFVSAGPAQTVPTGTPVQLAGNISGGSNTGTWSGGTGTFSNPTLPNAVYTPGAGETMATLTLTSADPPGPCGPKSATVIITFGTMPAAPSAQNTSVCSGSSVTLSATAPGGLYKWYDAAVNGTLLATGPNFTTPVLIANITYYVQTTVGGITSSRTAVKVTVNTVPAAPVAAPAQICAGSAATLTASGPVGSYAWYNAAAGGSLVSTNNVFTTPILTVNVSYYVEVVVNNCTSSRTRVDVTVNPVPQVISAASGTICSGQQLSYNITASPATATFNWGRAAVAGISNPAVNNQTSASITETLVNTSGAAVNVTYVITPTVGGCQGAAFNYVVTVNPAPVGTSASSLTVCDMTPFNYTVTFNTPVTGFSWSRAAVVGIGNLAVSGQTAGVIKEVLFNNTNSPVNATYAFTYKTATCAGVNFNLVVTVFPQAVITSPGTGNACTGVPQNYVITSNIPGATFVWSRAVVPNISNPAANNQTSGTINETLINTGRVIAGVIYNITPMANGCPGTPFRYLITVNPTINKPVASSNSPVCVGTDIHLSTPPIPGATYLWMGPNGYTSNAQNPDILNVTQANAGPYTLVYTTRGCGSPPVTVMVAVNQPPIAKAGPNQTVCAATPGVTLAGMISGGTTTGIWTTAGTGTFTPSPDLLNAQYIPSAADKAAGSVDLTLTSTSKDNCNVASSVMTITFNPQPAVTAGPDQAVCSQTTGVQLQGAITIAGGGTWSTAGSGTFSPSASNLIAVYQPSAADVKNGSVLLTLTANTAGACFIPKASLTVTFIPPPTVYAGGTRYVLHGNTITLTPTVSDPNVTYLWTPNADINNNTLKNPVITGNITRTYTLVITDVRGCTNQDTARIIVSPTINIVNTFTPNGDGLNDRWDISGLIAYQDASVDIFDRYGQKVYHSIGYPKPWDGTYNGKPVPVGVYYYLIDTHFQDQKFTGWVTVIR